MRNATSFLLALALCAMLAPSTQGQVVSANIVAAEGDPEPGGGPAIITNLDFNPVVNSNNQLAFSGDLDSGDAFLWYSGAIIFRSSDALPTILTGFETSFGISNMGEFAYSPSIDGEDGIWSDEGAVIRGDDPAPTFPGQFIVYASRPTMTDDGTAYWNSGITSSVGGSTEFEALYRFDRATDTYTVLAKDGDVYEGLPLDDLGFDFFVSRNDDYVFWQGAIDTGSSLDDDLILIGNDVIARENSPTGSPAGDNWDNFDLVSINDAGAFAFSGDTDGDANTDEFIAVGQVSPVPGVGGTPSIAMREGDVVDGVVVDGSVLALHVASAINFAAFAWSSLDNASVEGVFVGDLADLGNSTLVFKEGDPVDVDGDDIADYIIDELLTTATAQVGGGLALSNNGLLRVLVDLVPLTGGTAFEAMLVFNVSDIIPVELVSFTGVADGDAARLAWETSSETNNAGFEVQMDRGTGFEAVGFVNGHGTTTEAQTYRHSVTGLDAGTYAFRLKQIDFDGAFEYSDEVEVEIGLPESHRLGAAYPNPFNPSTQFTLAVAQSQDVTVAVYDALGRQVALLHEGALDAGTTHAFTLDASGLASGAYVIRAVGQQFTATQAITLLK